MLIKTKPDILASDIRAIEGFKARRTILKSGLAAITSGNGLLPVLKQTLWFGRYSGGIIWDW